MDASQYLKGSCCPHLAFTFGCIRWGCFCHFPSSMDGHVHPSTTAVYREVMPAFLREMYLPGEVTEKSCSSWGWKWRPARGPRSWSESKDWHLERIFEQSGCGNCRDEA
ncbi:uncharacterized protein LOC144159088 isoform X1 [Haemaphysalis longicornis]